ncbi:hypothetical protein Tco_1423468 [Tanacetum coccineum]
MRSLEETIIKFCEESFKKQAAEDEWIKKFIENTESNIGAIKTTTKILEEKAYQFTQTILTNTGEKFKARTIIGEENMKEPVPRELPPTPFLGHLKEEIGDMDVGWDITVEDVERLLKFLTPTIHTLPNHEPVIVHITPPDDDYVALATNPILNKHLNEFEEEFFDNIRVSNEINSNPVNDLKELLNTYDLETFI